MAKKISSKIDEIKKLLEADKFIIGADRTIKGLMKGTIQKVYLSSNTDKETRERIEHYAKLGKVELIQLDKSNEELGAFCKKPFKISVLSVVKE